MIRNLPGRIRSSSSRLSRSFISQSRLANAAPSTSTTPASSAPTSWSRPLAPGVLPAYDEALAYIERDAAKKRAALDKRKQDGVDAAELANLEILSEINLPEVRWNFKEGKLDLNKPVYRHLLDQRWRKKGRLDRLMERLYQMHVVPDVLPSIRPTVDLRVNFSTPPAKLSSIISEAALATVENPVMEKKRADNLEDVVPGVFLTPVQTLQAPVLTAQAFHPEERLYTLLMVDPDVPQEDAQTFQTYLHWLVPNISLSATSTSIPTSSIIPYIPPHPQNGTPAHRYVLLLLPQDPSITLDAEALSSIERTGLNVRAFVKEFGLDGEGGGAFMWRGIWDTSVSAIYNKVLGIPEPRYGPPPKFDPYVDSEGNRPKKYAS